MADGDLRLVYSSYNSLPGSDLTFGRVESGIYCLTKPSVTFGDPEIGDQDLPGEDGVRMGRDYQRSASVTLELGVDTVDYPAVRWYPPNMLGGAGRLIGSWPKNPMFLPLLKSAGGTPESWNVDAVAMLRQVWRADSLRGNPSRVAALVYTRAGRSRSLYGRPRNFEIGSEKFTAQGYTPVIAKFTAVDDRFYGSTAKQEELWDYYRPAPSPRPGRPTWPPVPTWEAKRTATLGVAGDLPVHPSITIYGPCTNPKVTIIGLWAVQLALTLKAGESVTVNAQPWARHVIKYTSTGASAGSVADKLTRASPRLAAMTLPPGRLQAQLSHSSTGTTPRQGPRVVIAWRDAFGSW
ncbi:hypothetical protein ACFWRZ_08565 [Streptomyces rubiginosohelvolus]|uniref:hypothetical protein n=1 Tax=Streptomyces rubiginosohelvolus TaxID=67362 RepID=UPI0036524BB2